MHGKPVLRDQQDGLQDIISLETAINFVGTPELTRQEFKNEADINTIMARFQGGSTAFPQKQPIFGEMDADLDLQGAYSAVEQAKHAFDKLDDETKANFGNWQTVLTAAHTGDLANWRRDQERRRQEEAAKARDAEISANEDAAAARARNRRAREAAERAMRDDKPE